MNFKYWNYCHQLVCIEIDLVSNQSFPSTSMNNLMYRNFNLFHFRKSRAISTMLSFHKKVYFISLIPTNSCWMNLHKKPFFTSVLLICHNSNCYYKQDLYFWKIHVSSRKKHFHSIPKHHSTNEIDLFRIWFHYQV